MTLQVHPFDTTTVTTDLDVVSSIAAMRNTLTGQKPVAWVQGYYSSGDGGGGMFRWDGGSVAADDGGYVIQPAGFPVGRYIRDLSQCNGKLSVLWWGAGASQAAADNVTAIQACLDYAGSQATSQKSVVFFPYCIPAGGGSYAIDATLTVDPYLTIEGDAGVYLVMDGAGNDILSMYGYQNRVENIGFDGGRHHIWFTTAGPDQVSWINNVIFLNNSGTAVATDSWNPPGDYSGNYQGGVLICSNFWGSGVGGLWAGGADMAIFRDGEYLWSPDGTTNTHNMNVQAGLAGGDGPGCFNAGTQLILDNVNIVPNTVAATRPAMIRGNGYMRLVNGTRLGGESVCAGIRTISTDFSKAVGDRPYVTITGCLIACTAQENWLECYETVPAQISFTNPTGYGEPGGFASTLYDSRGIWFDSNTITETNITDYGANGVIVDFESFASARSFTFRLSPLPTDLLGQLGVTDITPLFRSRYMRVDEPYRSDTLVQQNVFLDGVTSSQFYDSGAVTQFMAAAAADTSTGYSLDVVQATADSAQWQIILRLGGAGGTKWGGALPAGLYVFSFYVKASAPVTWIVGYNRGGSGYALRHVRTHASGTYQRVEIPHYHDGSDTEFTITVYDVLDNTTLSHGLYAIYAGAVSPPYTRPQNGTNNVVREQYQGTAAPVAGTYRVGDIMWNTSPVAGGFIGWVCTAAGSPGTWKTFGAISV